MFSQLWPITFCQRKREPNSIYFPKICRILFYLCNNRELHEQVDARRTHVCMLYNIFKQKLTIATNQAIFSNIPSSRIKIALLLYRSQFNYVINKNDQIHTRMRMNKKHNRKS